MVGLPLGYFIHWAYALSGFVAYWFCVFLAVALSEPRRCAIRKHVEAQLAARGEVDADVRGPDADRRALAAEVLAELASRWPRHDFIPEDPLEIIVGVHAAHETYLEGVARVVESRIGVCPEIGEADQLLQLTLGGFIDHLLAHGARPSRLRSDTPQTNCSQFARFPERSS
jgi:hypothetical protein